MGGVMGVTDPERVIDQFVKYFNSGDLEGILAELYEEDAVLLPGPGAPTVTGRDEIRPALKGFVDMGGTMSVLGATAMRNGDLALTHSKWRLEVPGSDPMEGTTAEVVRRQSDGSWKYILDNPFGGAALDAAG
jgi:uncharacterized protein (TIGR02246 family)